MGTLLATAMTIKNIFLYLFVLLLSCGPDYGVHTEVVEVVEGPPTDVVVDSLIQPSPPEKIDVLLVLDTSCSMSDNYDQVSRGVEFLRGDIEQLTMDYKIGFINTSLNGHYFSGPYDVTSNVIDFLLAPWALTGDSTEAGFSSLYRFVTTTQEGLDFFREDSDKLIIFISDEDEQSSITASIIHDWLKDTYAAVQHDIVSIVEVEGGECATSSYTFTVGTKYIELANYYGKNGVDICSDWEEWLSDSTFLVGEIKHINLSETPVEESIIVYHNNTITELWYYLPETNTVYLDFLPSEGDLIEVGYVAFTK